MDFILVKKDHFHDDEIAKDIPCKDRFGFELIRTKDIVHVYEVKGSFENQICIEYVNRKGVNSSIYETYSYEYEIVKRINELNILLKGGKQDETV